MEKSQILKPPLVLSGMMVLFFYFGWFAVPNEIEDNDVYLFYILTWNGERRSVVDQFWETESFNDVNFSV